MRRARRAPPIVEAQDEAGQSKLIERALGQEPRLLALGALVRAQEWRTRSVSAELLPDLTLTGSVSGRAGGSTPSAGEVPSGAGWLATVPNWDVGVLLSWPLFNLGVRTRRDASRVREQVAAAELLDGRQRVVAVVQQALLGLRAAQGALPALESSEKAAKENQAQAEARFGAGLGTSVELADAEELFTDAQIQHAIGRFEVARAAARLSRMIPEGK